MFVKLNNSKSQNAIDVLLILLQKRNRKIREIRIFPLINKICLFLLKMNEVEYIIFIEEKDHQVEAYTFTY